VYDRLGHGQSEHCLQYEKDHFEQRAKELGALISHLGFDSVYLCGICEGGVVALVLASLWPEKVKAMVCQGVGYYATDETIAACEKYFRSWSEIDGKLRQRLIDYHGKDYAMMKWESVRQTKHYVWDPSYDLRPILPHIKMPTLIMGGDRDPFFGIEHPVAAFRGVKSAELCIVPGGGHFLNEEAPGLFNSIVSDFLERQIKAFA
jgi:pimeloyl-ACP methyl ester carboxylesterase